MKEYHKIQTVFLRDPATKFKTLLMGQYATPEFEYLAENKWIFTEKVNGTNIRVAFNGQSITFGGKTDNAQIPAFLVQRLQEHFLPKVSTFDEKFKDGVCLYGEGYGGRIQKGSGNYRQDSDFVLFDVRIGDWWLQRKDVEEIATTLSIEVVPIIGEGNLPELVTRVQAGFNSRWGNFLAEGIVARPATELKDRSGHRVITKLKHKDFLGSGVPT